MATVHEKSEPMAFDQAVSCEILILISYRLNARSPNAASSKHTSAIPHIQSAGFRPGIEEGGDVDALGGTSEDDGKVFKASG